MVSLSAIYPILILIGAFLSLIVLMIIHEFGHFIIAKKFGVKVEEFGIGYPPRICGKKIGETIYSLNWIPLGAFVRILGEEGGVDDYRSFTNLKIWQRVLIIIGGVVAFWITAIVLFSVVFAIGADLPANDTDIIENAQLKVVSISNDSPASNAGLQVRDTIKGITINGVETPINKVSEFQTITGENRGKEIAITVERGSQNDLQTLNLKLTPRVNPPEGEGVVGIGIQRMATLIQKTAWYMAPVQGTIYTWQMTVGTVEGLYVLLAGLVGGNGNVTGENFAGPLGITIFMANAASYGAGFFLYFIGIISVSLAIFNLFPIPALDGGKLIFLTIEKIKGKPVSEKVEGWITTVCFVTLIVLSLYITVRFDISRFANFLQSALSR